MEEVGKQCRKLEEKIKDKRRIKFEEKVLKRAPEGQMKVGGTMAFTLAEQPIRLRQCFSDRLSRKAKKITKKEKRKGKGKHLMGMPNGNENQVDKWS